MSTHERDNSGVTAVRHEHRFDEAALGTWMVRNVEGFNGPLTVQQFKGGQSNPTFKLLTPARAYVLRRKPPGQLLRGAHAVEREFEVISALGRTGFPVARAYALCTDDNVIGSWFYVMDCVEGRIVWDTTFPAVPRAERPKYFDAMNATIAQLHQIDYAAIGLSDYGKHGDYVGRQIRTWSKQYQADPEAGRDDNMDRLIAWLSSYVPATDETSIVHGDFRCDNMIFHPSEPRVLAVLDWELSTLGHPLADFAYSGLIYRLEPDITAGLVGTDLAAMNIPSEAEYLAAYARRTGRASLPDYDYYIAFNLFRLAAIFHGIRGRVLRGNAANANAKARSEQFPRIAALAWAQAERAMKSR